METAASTRPFLSPRRLSPALARPTSTVLLAIVSWRLAVSETHLVSTVPPACLAVLRSRAVALALTQVSPAKSLLLATTTLAEMAELA